MEQMNNMGLSEASGVKDVEVGDLSSMLSMDSTSTKVLVGWLTVSYIALPFSARHCLFVHTKQLEILKVQR